MSESITIAEWAAQVHRRRIDAEITIWDMAQALQRRLGPVYTPLLVRSVEFGREIISPAEMWIWNEELERMEGERTP